MDMECINGRMETDTKESGEHVSDMEMAPISSRMEINTLVNISMVILMGLGSTSGLMAIHMQESLRMDLKMEKESGRRRLKTIRELIITLKENTKMT